jgi:hypothetical protein
VRKSTRYCAFVEDSSIRAALPASPVTSAAPLRLAAWTGSVAAPDGCAAALWSSRSMSSRAFLNSFMLCPRLRAKSGNFFAPNRTRTMRRMINRSGPPRFPIPNARIFIIIQYWSGPMIYSREPANSFSITGREYGTHPLNAVVGGVSLSFKGMPGSFKMLIDPLKMAPKSGFSSLR